MVADEKTIALVRIGMLLYIMEICVMMFYCIIFFFFFQAEDGIRDVERSRGLGDVYKRQDYRGILTRARKPSSVSRPTSPSRGLCSHP